VKPREREREKEKEKMNTKKKRGKTDTAASLASSTHLPRAGIADTWRFSDQQLND
jgi:hypothetical protein